jgi:hypothetical protein
MEYLGLLPLAAAITGVSLRCYFSMKKKALLAEAEQQLSPRAERVQAATIARRLLRYHQGLSHA